MSDSVILSKRKFITLLHGTYKCAVFSKSFLNGDEVDNFVTKSVQQATNDPAKVLKPLSLLLYRGIIFTGRSAEAGLDLTL